MGISGQGRVGYWMHWRDGVNMEAIGVIAEAVVEAGVGVEAAVRVERGALAGKVDRHQIQDHDTFHVALRAPAHVPGHVPPSVHVVEVSHLIEWKQMLDVILILRIKSRWINWLSSLSSR